VLGAIWIACVVAGLAFLMRYDNEPGLAATPPDVWPVDATIRRVDGQPTLIMLAHPQCDCTRASLGELAELLARAPSRARAFVVFVRPEGVNPGWERTGGLWDRAAGIPDVTVLADERGREAKRFGVHTSGQALLYDAGGHLVFSGGLTPARARTGNSAGRTAILAWLQGERVAITTSPVFGCYLLGPMDPEPAERPRS
jgi:hypothetical protein